MKIEALMTRDVVTCGEEATLDVPARLMWERNVGSIVVLDGDGKLAGMVTDRDVAMAAQTQGRRLGEISVDVAMSREVATCAPGDSPQELCLRMRDEKVRRLPVVDAERRVVGIVSLDDLARAGAEGKNGIPLKELAAAYAASARAESRETGAEGQQRQEDKWAHRRDTVRRWGDEARVRLNLMGKEIRGRMGRFAEGETGRKITGAARSIAHLPGAILRRRQSEKETHDVGAPSPAPSS